LLTGAGCWIARWALMRGACLSFALPGVHDPFPDFAQRGGAGLQTWLGSGGRLAVFGIGPAGVADDLVFRLPGISLQWRRNAAAINQPWCCSSRSCWGGAFFPLRSPPWKRAVLCLAVIRWR